MNISQAKERLRKFLAIIVYSFFGYAALWVLTWAISAASVNSGASYEIKKSMHEHNCQSSMKTKDFNPANIVAFYLDWNYWTAEYRVGLNEFNNPQCLNVLMQSINMFKNPNLRVKVVVIDEKNNIVMSIRKQAL